MKARVYLQTFIDIDVGGGWVMPRDTARLQKEVDVALEKLQADGARELTFTPLYVLINAPGLGEAVHVFEN